jgi:hypothetical protein
MTFPENKVAVPGVDGADLRIVTIDTLYPALADIYVMGPDDDIFTFYGSFADTAHVEIDLDLLPGGEGSFGPVKSVMIVQHDDCEGIFDPLTPLEGAFYESTCTSDRDGLGHLGFDVDAVEALSFDDFPSDDGTVIQCGEGEGEDPCANFEDPEGQWEASCEDCGNATITINDEQEGEVANIDVGGDTPDDGFTLELIDNNPPPRWWRTATVFVTEDDVEQEMDRCTLREIARWLLRQQRPATDGCFYLTPLFQPFRLKYTVLWPTDPGFSFR